MRDSQYKPEPPTPMIDRLLGGEFNSPTIKQAVARIQKAGIIAPKEVILRFVRCCGPESILQASLREIREVANAL